MKASNVVLIGAASRLLPIKDETLEKCIRDLFARKGQDIIDTNIAALRKGIESSTGISAGAYTA